ncbi:MAG: DUF1761 domain-containing protein [Deltaproteobacteria bacterium]|nr:DUF1761 domain-containing protein [Deltaproteobacteria bacterium]
MQPTIHLDFAAILVAVLSNLVLGGLWYGPMFGGTWAKLVGMDISKKPPASAMVRGYVMMVVGAFLTAYVLAHSAEVWRPSSWGLQGDAPAWTYGVMSAGFTWVGFYLPVLSGSVAWEGKSWKLFAINAAYYFVALQIMGAILAFWR